MKSDLQAAQAAYYTADRAYRTKREEVDRTLEQRHKAQQALAICEQRLAGLQADLVRLSDTLDAAREAADKLADEVKSETPEE